MSVFDYLDQEPDAPPPPRMSDLWEWARDDYFAGESADVVCERHKLSRSQFFERARREGWLRRDQPRTSTEPVFNAEEEDAFVQEALDRPPPSAYALYRQAWARAERAILMGRRVEAAGWNRLARDLRKLALEEDRSIAWKGVTKAHEPDSPDSPDSPIPSSPAHPRGSGDPGLQPSEPSLGPSREGGAAAASLAPRIRGDNRNSDGGRKVEGGKPDSPDSPSATRPVLNRQDRRRLAKLGAHALAEKPRPGFRGVDAMR